VSDGQEAICFFHPQQAELASAMEEFYREVDRAVAEYAPVCRNRGLCCRFDAYGHRLYVTTAEVAFFVRGMSDHWRTLTTGRSCPFQVEGQCVARAYRPLGCRIFFCDPATTDWQSHEYERHLRLLKQVMDKLDIDYRYMEWLSALALVDKALGGKKSPKAESD